MRHVIDPYEPMRAGVLVVMVIALSGCRAGYRAPNVGGQLSYGSGIVKMGAVNWDLPARDLDRALGATDAGQILQKSLIAHGGWDRWRSLTHVEYRRLRVDARGEEEARSVGDDDESPPLDGGAANPEAEPESRDVAFDPRGWGGARDEDASMFSLPFLLLRGGYTQEYLGTEIDVTQELEFHKIRFVRSQEGDPSLAEEFVVYFDHASGLLKQLFIQRAPDEWLFVRMSGWETVVGFRLATRRKIYRLEKMFQRLRPEALVWRDTLVDINIR